MATTSGIRAGRAFVDIEAVDKTALVLKRIESKFRAFGQKLSQIGQNMVAKGLAALTPAALSLKVFANFDDSMRRLEARSSGTAEELKTLREQAKLLGSTTSFTASQVGQLQASLAQKGFNRSQIAEMTKDIVNLTSATGSGNEGDTVLAADLVSGTLRAFKMEANEASRVADIYTAAVNNSNFSLEGLITSMASAGPVASKYNLSLEDTVATLAGMTNLNIDASTAGTAFRNMLLKMSDAAGREKFNETLKEATGRTVDFVDASGNLRNLPSLLFEIGDAISSLGTAEQGELLNQLFGLRALVPAGALSTGENAFKGLVEILENSEGAAAEAAETMESGLGGSFRKTLSAIEGVAIALGEALDGPLSGMLTWLGTALGSLTSFIAKNENLISLIFTGIGVFTLLGATLTATGIIVSSIGALFGVLATAITTAFGIMKVAVISFAVVLGVLSSPLLIIAGVVTTILAAISLGIAHYTGALEKAKDKSISAYETIKKKAMEIAAPIIRVFKAIMKAFQAGDLEGAARIAFAALKVIWYTGTNQLLDVWDSWKNKIMDTATQLGFDFLRWGVKLWFDLQELWVKGGDGILESLEAIRDGIMETIADELQMITDVTKAFIKFGYIVKDVFDVSNQIIFKFVTLIGSVAKAIESLLFDLFQYAAEVLGLVDKKAQEHIIVISKEQEENLDKGLKDVEIIFERDKTDTDIDEKLKKLGELKEEEKALLAKLDAEEERIMKERLESSKKAKEERDAALLSSKEELEGLLAEMEKEREEIETEIEKSKDDETSKKIGGLPDVAAKTPISSNVIQALEKGSVEAFTKAFENRQNGLLESIISEEMLHRAVSEKILKANKDFADKMLKSLSGV